jgi:hypothetical protein
VPLKEGPPNKELDRTNAPWLGGVALAGQFRRWADTAAPYAH